MRRLVITILLFAAAAAGAAPCSEPSRIPVARVAIEPQCGYHTGAIAAAGDTAFAAWMTSRVGGFSPHVTGTTSGGTLDADGTLRDGVQKLLNRAPAPPSVATNGQRSMLAWTYADATWVRFADTAEPVAVVSAKSKGISRAIWNGRDWIVIASRDTDIVAVRVRNDGSVAEEREIAAEATLFDAIEAGDGRVLVLLRHGSALLDSSLNVVTRSGSSILPNATSVSLSRDGDGFIAAWHSGVVGMQQLDSVGAERGGPQILDSDAGEIKRVAAAGRIVLWNDGLTVRSSRDGVIGEGTLLGATVTTRGAVALLAQQCGMVTTLLLDHGSAPKPVSLAPVPQTAHAIIPTTRGQQVFWSEPVPSTRSIRFFATHITNTANDPVRLNADGTYLFFVSAAPMAGGSVVAWGESHAGQARVQMARFDGNGQRLGEIVTVGQPDRLGGVAIAANETSIVVFTAEKNGFDWYSDLFATRFTPAGEPVQRTQVAQQVDALALDAAMSSSGAVASWFNSLPDDVRLLVRDSQTLRAFPMPNTLQVIDTAAADVPLVVWLERSSAPRLHALFANTGADVIAGEPAGGAFITATAAARHDGAFDVGWSESIGATTRLTTIRISAEGTVTPQQESCLAIGGVYLLSLRNGAVDAVVSWESPDGVTRATLARKPTPKRRAVR